MHRIQLMAQIEGFAAKAVDAELEVGILRKELEARKIDLALKEDALASMDREVRRQNYWVQQVRKAHDLTSALLIQAEDPTDG